MTVKSYTPSTIDVTVAAVAQPPPNHERTKNAALAPDSVHPDEISNRVATPSTVSPSPTAVDHAVTPNPNTSAPRANAVSVAGFGVQIARRAAETTTPTPTPTPNHRSAATATATSRVDRERWGCVSVNGITHARI